MNRHFPLATIKKENAGRGKSARFYIQQQIQITQPDCCSCTHIVFVVIHHFSRRIRRNDIHDTAKKIPSCITDGVERPFDERIFRHTLNNPLEISIVSIAIHHHKNTPYCHGRNQSLLLNVKGEWIVWQSWRRASSTRNCVALTFSLIVSPGSSFHQVHSFPSLSAVSRRYE